MLLKQFPDKKEFLDLAENYNVIPVCSRILADMQTPVSLLKTFHEKKKPVFLFESVEGGERWGRYSFLGTSAHSSIKVFRNHVEITDKKGSQTIPHENDPLNVLRNIMMPLKAPEIQDLPRFWGGMVGYLTYETVSFFEKIENRLPEGKPVASFVIPDSVIVFDNIKHCLTAVSIAFTDDFENPETAYDDAEKRLSEICGTIEGGFASSVNAPETLDLELSAQSPPEDYENKVMKVKEYIHSGDIIQAVISQPFVCDAPSDIVELYRAQRYINPSPYLFFLDIDDTALVGSSPETMVRLENGIATLRPIAGTRPRGKNEQEDRAMAADLLSDEKEKAEHLMLVDLGRNDLGRIAETGTVQVTDLMVVERYSHVMHLVSNITCDINPDTDAWDLIRSSFPAGTLSGAPKVRAMEIISEMEDGPRGPYGGAVGYVSFSGNMDMAITIRTACVENGKVVVRAGAGIVADSDPVKERVETENKSKSVQKALEMINIAG